MVEESVELKRALDWVPGSGAVYSIVDYVAGWARKYSIWPMHFVTGCCGPEFMQTSGVEYDMERLGILPFASVRQCDCIMVIGVVSRKMAIRVKYLYEQMGEPKWVVSVGACPTGKGPFFDSYGAVPVDEYVPVDIYIPGCPPRPEAIIHGMMLLQDMIKNEKRIGVKRE
ncbi:MAG: NADH-quinone oxidoreductase subunit NuoB [Candidatus Bathyarchaeota archaeon]|nr:NADH-quinone oxidoreductase subunit NuoB [Candidatus Bathyarchaeota archaeon]